MSEHDSRVLGIVLMILTMFIFAVQDGISRHLAEAYNTVTIVMIRYWFLAVFVVVLAAVWQGGVRHVAKTERPFLQIFRSVLLVAEIILTVVAFIRLGLLGTHAIFASFPLIATALAVPVLGERVGWRRWSAIGLGFLGVLFILRPGFEVFSPDALIPLAAACLFALYHVLTRMAAWTDTPQTSFFWTGVAGALAITLIGPWYWEPPTGADWGWMLALCLMSALGHYLLIKVLTLSQATTVQPYSYFQFVFAAGIGVAVFGEAPDIWTIIGGGIIVAAGIFAMSRQDRHPA